MSRNILVPHIQGEESKRPLIFSIVGHLGLFAAVLFGSDLFAPSIIEIGSGQGGGQGGDVITVGLTDLPSGGTGMYKPSVVPTPQALPPEPKEEKVVEQAEEAPVEETVFEQAAADAEPEPAALADERPPPAAVTRIEEPAPGVIRQAPEPGSGGPGGGSAGSGGGFGGGVGVSIGSGTGGRGIDSWYVRQVEKRIGQNWLKTSMGQLRTPVRTTVSFEISPSGKIENVKIDQGSGMRSVDLAAQRAVLASTPLPPLPLELRRRKVRFVAHFEYPPR